MTDQAKVRIGGDASGATRAMDQTSKGLKDAGTVAQETGKKMQTAAEQAAAAEKKYEGEVQKAIQRLKNKETQAKATEEAMKRLGVAANGSTGNSRGAFTGAPPTVGGVAPGGVAQGLARIGGAGGAAMGAIGSSLSQAAPALAAVGVAAVGLKVGLDALRAASEQHAQVIGQTIKIEQQRKDIIEQASKQLAATVMGAAAEGGGALRETIARGGSIAGVQGLADRTGLNAGQASQVSQMTSGLDDQSKKVIEQAVKDAVRLGVDPVKTAEALRASSKGGLGDMDREAALRNAGNLFDNFSGYQIQSSLTNDPDLDRLQKISEYSTRDSRAAFGTIANNAAIGITDSVTGESAKRTADPITAGLAELDKTLKKEIEVLEGMAKGEHPLIRALNDLGAKLQGGSGSYEGQARNLRRASGTN